MHADDFAELSQLVRRDAGAVLTSSDTYAVERRLEQLAKGENLRGVTGLLAAARAGDGELRRRICETVAVHETRFFRDENVFAALADVVARKSSVTVWSAACASGQEAASIAIMMREKFPGVPLRIVATDLSRAMVDRVRRGVFTPFEVTRGLTVGQRDRHFKHVPAGYQLRDEMRSQIEARTLNLAGAWPTWPAFDIVLLRNVLVYLDPGVRREVLQRARGVLAPDGVLALGATEHADPDAYTRVASGTAVLYRPIQELR